MEKYIEHSMGNSVVLIPVDPCAFLKVEFVPSEISGRDGRGDVNAKVGNLSFLLHGDVREDQAGELISTFVDKYKSAATEQKAEKEYVSTKWVVAVCLIVTFIVLYLSDSGDDVPVLQKELAKMENEVFAPSEQTVDEIMEIPAQRVLDVMDAKERYLAALEKMQGMSADEREAFIKTPQMQELINTSWVEHIRQE